MKNHLFIASCIFVCICFFIYQLLTPNYETAQQDSHVENIKQINEKSSLDQVLIVKKRSPISLINNQDNALRNEPESTISQIKEYGQLINEPNKLIVEKLDKIESLQTKVLTWKKLNHIQYSKIENWDPRLILTIAYLKNLTYRDTLKLNVSLMKLDIEYWELLKRFSKTNDLKILIRQNKLNSEYLTKKNLFEYYSK